MPTNGVPRSASTAAAGRRRRHELERGRRLGEHVLLLELAIGQGVWEQLHSAVVVMVLSIKPKINIQM